MEYMPFLALGLILGALVVIIINMSRRRNTESIARELIAQTESQKVEDLERIFERVRESFGALSLEALSKNTKDSASFPRRA